MRQVAGGGFAAVRRQVRSMVGKGGKDRDDIREGFNTDDGL